MSERALRDEVERLGRMVRAQGKLIRSLQGRIDRAMGVTPPESDLVEYMAKIRGKHEAKEGA